MISIPTPDVPPLTIAAWLRWDVVSAQLPSDAKRVLDIGAGSGSYGLLLAERYDYTGVEPDPNSYAIAAKRIGTRGRVVNCRFEDLQPRRDYDLVCAFEVLEHIDDDSTALGQWVRHLRPGGWLLISVPCGRKRYGPGDALVGDLRRYEPSDVVTMFERVGVQLVARAIYGSPWGNLQGLVQELAVRIHPSGKSNAERTASSGRLLQPPDWAAAMTRVAAYPLQLLQRPLSRRGIGTGLVALGRLEPR